MKVGSCLEDDIRIQLLLQTNQCQPTLSNFSLITYRLNHRETTSEEIEDCCSQILGEYRLGEGYVVAYDITPESFHEPPGSFPVFDDGHQSKMSRF